MSKTEVSHLSGNPNLLSRNARISDPLTNFLFVLVSKRGVDVTIAGLQRVLDHRRRGIRRNVPSSAANGRDLCAYPY